MAKTNVPVTKISLSLSAAAAEKLREAMRLSGSDASLIIAEIVEDNLPKWIQKYHMRHSFSKAAEKVKASASPEIVLIKQDELDKIFRLMSAPQK
ncbi:MAG: hypothetical protein LBT68_00220 [Spirochaetales bacterium]|nr:hypothetical protein [Spirochaetales bacterium]